MENRYPDSLVSECDITFFVPCYNEENNVVSTFKNIISAAKEVGISYEILVVDDKSQDKTIDVIEDFMEANPEIQLVLVKNKKNLGLGRNYVEGAYIAKGKYYMLVCGDNAEPRETIVSIIQNLGQADMIVPFFGRRDARNLGRRAISAVFTKLVNLLSGQSLRYYNGPVAHLKFNVMRWHADTDGFGYQAEILTRLLEKGTTYVEVEVSNYNRCSGVTKAFSVQNILAVCHSLTQITLRRIRWYLFYSDKR